MLLACFPKASFGSSEVDRVNKVDGIDNSLCPYLTLPRDWNSYLDTLSANTLQKIRRLLKQVDVAPGESNNRFDVRDVPAGPQDLAGIPGHEVVPSQRQQDG